MTITTTITITITLAVTMTIIRLNNHGNTNKNTSHHQTHGAFKRKGSEVGLHSLLAIKRSRCVWGLGFRVIIRVPLRVP